MDVQNALPLTDFLLEENPIHGPMYRCRTCGIAGPRWLAELLTRPRCYFCIRDRRKDVQTRNHFVYLAAGPGNLLKVGVSNAPHLRMKTLETPTLSGWRLLSTAGPMPKADAFETERTLLSTLAAQGICLGQVDDSGKPFDGRTETWKRGDLDVSNLADLASTLQLRLPRLGSATSPSEALREAVRSNASVYGTDYVHPELLGSDADALRNAAYLQGTAQPDRDYCPSLIFDATIKKHAERWAETGAWASQVGTLTYKKQLALGAACDSPGLLNMQTCDEAASSLAHWAKEPVALLARA